MILKWQRERLSLQFPGSNAPLRDLRIAIADLTNIPTFKLIHAGAVMKDDNAPLSAYHLTNNSTIVLIPLNPPPHQTIQQSQDPSENATLALIKAELDTVHLHLLPDVTAFHAALASPHPPTTREYNRLGELLLQSLLRLDALSPDREWLAARTDRKAAVKEVQELLDNLDSAWAESSSS